MLHPLAPISALYALVTDIRNWMFDRGWLQEKVYAVPVICIGNLAVGGTGKTPHCEWIVDRLLADQKHVAILSRGYGRKTKGFREAMPTSRANEIGDEPLQMYHRFGGKVIVAVCEDRRKGIEQLLERHNDINVIVLDDAFQHRYVRPRLRILLTEYASLYSKDHVLPAGRLRERAKGAARADIIIVTKCPAELTAKQQQEVVDSLKPQKHQQVYFSSMKYAPLPELSLQPSTRIALLAGIAHPEPFANYFNAQGSNIAATLFYGDHHNFSSKDIARIEATAKDTDLIITTAKDYARLRSLSLSESTFNKIKVQHISVDVLGDETTLYQTIKSYVDTH